MHSHDHSAVGLNAARRVRRALTLVAAALIAVAAAGMAVLWPGQARQVDAGPDVRVTQTTATVRSVEEVTCAGGARALCLLHTVEVHGGPDAGSIATFELTAGPRTPELAAGDRIVVNVAPDLPLPHRYQFADIDRQRPLLLLGAAFALAVLALGRWQGLRALGGVVASLVVLAAFALPALLSGAAPLAVATVSAIVIATFALYLTHGLRVSTTVALLGTIGSLALTALLGAGFLHLARFSGLADHEAGYLAVAAAQVDLRGLLLAGIVIGTLGVLDDVTVTQVAAVAEVHRANPSLSTRELFNRGMKVGRDHVAATVNTLVLAYAGASLPLLLLFTQTRQPIGQVLTGEAVAVEVVRTLVGSIGLVASVPLTTWLAAVTAGSGAASDGHGRAGRAGRDG